MAVQLDAGFLARLERLELVSRKIFLGRTKGERLSKRKGQSVEFADFRNYVSGDDLRFLDWNLFARLDKLYLRQFLEEEDLHFSILIDGSRSMDFGTPSKFDYARQVAAALGFIGLVNHDRVSIDLFGQRLVSGSGALRGRRNLPRLLGWLNAISPVAGGDFGASLKEFSMRSSGKGVVIVLSDFMDKGGYEAGLRYLVARSFDIYCIQILAPEEVNPPYTGDLKLTDIEDDDEAEVTVSAPLLKRYRETLERFRAGLNEYCSRRGVRCLFTSTQVPFEKLVLDYLRQRGLLR